MIAPTTSPTPELDRLVVSGGRPVGLEHWFVDRPWGQQHVVTAGPVGARPLVLVHGWPQHWFAWREVIAGLAGSAHVVAIDVRGFGWSSGTHRGATIAGLGDDILAVVDALGLGPVVLAAHDWGGWIAFDLVLRRPTMFDHYLAMAIVPPWLRLGRMLRHLSDWEYVYVMAVLGRHVARWPRGIRWMLDHSTGETIWGRPVHALAVASYLDRIGRPDAVRMTRRLYALLALCELPKAWGPRRRYLQVPTTVLVGAQETIARPAYYLDRTRVDELEVVTVPRARHWLAEERPHAVIEHLQRVMGIASGLEVDEQRAGERPGGDP